jgi:hypothetical protein
LNEQEMRLLVREAIARVGAARANAGAILHAPAQGFGGPAVARHGGSDRSGRGHASHAMFVLPAGIDTDGPCIIEPSVPCNHCGFCKSYGH